MWSLTWLLVGTTQAAQVPSQILWVGDSPTPQQVRWAEKSTHQTELAEVDGRVPALEHTLGATRTCVALLTDGQREHLSELEVPNTPLYVAHTQSEPHTMWRWSAEQRELFFVQNRRTPPGEATDATIVVVPWSTDGRFSDGKLSRHDIDRVSRAGARLELAPELRPLLLDTLMAQAHTCMPELSAEQEDQLAEHLKNIPGAIYLAIEVPRSSGTVLLYHWVDGRLNSVM